MMFSLSDARPISQDVGGFEMLIRPPILVSSLLFFRRERLSEKTDQMTQVLRGDLLV